MRFAMSHYIAVFIAILITREIILSANGQCTVRGFSNGESLVSIVAEIQQLRVELFDQLNKEIHSIHEHLNASHQDITGQLTIVNVSLKAVERRLLEQDICTKQGQNIHELLNESFQEMKSQHSIVMTTLTSLQSCDRRLQEHDISIKNQSQNVWNLTNGTCSNASDVCDCYDIKASGQTASGVYEVCVGYQPDRVCTYAYCYMNIGNATSLVFQRRTDGSVNFNRTWADYKHGFGDRNGEFWLGNEVLHLFTSSRNYKLRVELEDFDGNKRVAEYLRFSINSSADKYRLTVSGYSGNAGDSMAYSNGKQFSTSDVGDDRNSCARRLGEGWWHSQCSEAHLNGIYNHTYRSIRPEIGFKWFRWHNTFAHSLKASEMKLVPLP